MNIKLVRNIDYWLGIPLCFLLSGLNCILKIIPSKKNRIDPPKKILFIKFSELGTIVLSYPLLESVKKRYPSAELFFVVFYKNRFIFKLFADIIPNKHILCIREELGFFILDTWRVIKRLRKEGLDIVFDLEFFSRFSAIFSFFIGAKKRIGFYRYAFEGLYRGNFLTHKIQYNPLEHITRNYLSLKQKMEEITKNTPELEEKINENEISFPGYKTDAQEKERVLNKLSVYGIKRENKLFLINPGEGVLPLREWPIDYFITLSKLILKDKNNFIIFVGTQGATNKTKTALDILNNPRCASLVDKTGLSELMELFYLSEALISNDCGLAHLAMLTSVKKFIIFGPESPQIFGQLGEKNWQVYSNWPCSPCLSVLNHRNSACRDNICLKVIKPKDIFDLIFPNTLNQNCKSI